VALSATCTHQNCTITGQYNQDFVCPCHGSMFSASGQVLSGPAPRALTRYQTQLSGDVLTITG
jgi:Rieske Fe-S protein